MDELMGFMVLGAVLFLAGMIVNEILRNYEVNDGKMQLPDENTTKKKNRRKDDYVKRA